MPTINQLVKKGRKRILQKNASPALQRNPQKRGVCVRVQNCYFLFFIKNPTPQILFFNLKEGAPIEVI